VKAARSAVRGADAKSWDDHSRWQEIRQQELTAETLLRNAACEAVAQPERLSESERRLLKTLCPQWGVDPGDMLESLGQAAETPAIDWRAALRRYLGEELGPELSYRRPPRRFPDLLGVIPATATTPTKPRILCALDTSGSMDNQTLTEIAGELERLRKEYEVTLIECDTRVQRARKLRGKVLDVAGRGGTDLTVPFSKRVLRRYRPDVILCCTDGFGPTPRRPPLVPTIWLLTPDGRKPVSWGRTIRLGNPH
jgi:predicted metal-dependent peptidase